MSERTEGTVVEEQNLFETEAAQSLLDQLQVALEQQLAKIRQAKRGMM
jgi:hypothetical protein